MKTLLISLAVLVAVAFAESDNCEKKCAKCPVVERSECLAGMTKDGECGCCDVCSRFEGQKCDQKDAPFKHGQCGDDLVCRKATGGDICQCIWDEIVCGTDGVTYSNLCQLMAAVVREGKQKQLEVKSRGPCDPGAQIVTKPEYVRNTTNNNVVLVCEAIGFPVPSISWVVKKANEKVFDIPGDDSHVVTSMRGGPGKFQLTSWLQIEGLHKRHEGDYTCTATNEHRTDKATARIKVVN